MKLLLTLITILVLAIIFSFWAIHFLEDSSAELLQNIEKTALLIEQEQWEGTYQQTSELEQNLHTKTHWWPVLINHREIDAISLSFASFKEYVTAQNTPLARGELSRLKAIIERIAEKEAVTLENIL